MQDTNQTNTNTFVKGLNKDSDPSFVSEGMWLHSRNAVNNTSEGDLATLSNESSTVFCAAAGETLAAPNSKKYTIGAIYLYSDKWVLFTVAYAPNGLGNPINSEIGLFEEDTCTYRPIVQAECLNFNKYYLISGASREREDCTWQVYWADGLNPDRVLNIGDPQTWPPANYTWQSNNYYSDGVNNILWPNVAWIQECNIVGNCEICIDLPELDCDKIRLARLMKTPCLKVKKAVGAGTLENGSYWAVMAYSIKGQKVTDYFSQSNVQPIYFPGDLQGSLEIEVDADQDAFDEFILVVVQNINQQTVAKEIGIYSTRTTVIQLDQIKNDLVSIPIRDLPVVTPVYEKSDQMLEVNNYLLRVGPTSKFDFNYQPLANLIETEWVSIEYPAEYYYKGGSNTSYLRDEVYAFFIRWVYNTGDKSASYHIPGRGALLYNGQLENSAFNNDNTLAGDTLLFQTINTATVTSTVTSPNGDGGTIISRGKMGYWQSTEIYPDNRADIWNSSSQCWTGVPPWSGVGEPPYYELCGQPIRHHRFPDNATHPTTNHFGQNGETIRIMGVEFKNIIYPKDNDGNDIPGIVGYEILRGSREGNRSIIAKGMINNLRPYSPKGGTFSTTKRGLYPNHPFNTIIPPGASTNPSDYNYQYFDPYIKATTDTNPPGVFQGVIPTNIVTFHSPDTSFRNPFLSGTELKLYGQLHGISQQQFIEPSEHPRHKLLANLGIWMMIVGGIIEGMIANIGKRTINQPGAGHTRKFGPDYEQEDISGGATGTDSVTGAYVLVSGLASGTVTYATNVTYSNLSGNGGTTEEYEYTDNGSGTTSDFQNNLSSFNNAYDTYTSDGGAIKEAYNLIGNQPLGGTYTTFNDDGGLTRGGIYTAPYFNTELSGWQQFDGSPIATVLSAVTNVSKFLYYFSQGADITLRIIYTIIPYRQYALQMIAHGYYNQFISPLNSQRKRFNINDGLYLKDSIQELPEFSGFSYRVHNLKRSDTVVLRTTNNVNADDGPALIVPTNGYTNIDTSLVTIGTLNGADGVDFALTKSKPFNRVISSHYAGIKLRIDNQYGQLESIKQIVASPCEYKFDPATLPEIPTANTCPISGQVFHKVIQATGTIFGGDTYINRYTEKNTMFMFYDWLYGQPNGYEYSYYTRQMIPEPRFWMNSELYEASNLQFNLTNILNPLPDQGLLPNTYYKLDNVNYDYTNDEIPSTLGLPAPFDYPFTDGYPGFFGVKESYFYLFTSGVRDFFVESDVIVDFREEGFEQWQKNYNPYRYTDLPAMFNSNPQVITRGNYNAYDYSLSISKLFIQYYSQGALQSRYYDPNVSKLCFTYLPDRIIYSLPQQQQSFKDSWYVYLANNYKEFKNQISGVKNFAKTGIFITFKNSSPLVLQGIDQLQTESGTKITIGDGGLFAQTPQSVVIADDPYEYGSSQNRRSVISTPAGMFYMSQNQGKVFNYTQGLTEISQQGLKWWFTLFMPYKLTIDFPNYPHQDNPVAGIGCQSVYDNQNSVLYFTKKDYKLKENFVGQVTYDDNQNAFIYNNIPFGLGDPILFDDASWTVSYDPKSKYWISFHDWHPDLVLPSKNTFISTKENSLWIHNDKCSSYCNFYGVDYPFEVDIPMVSGQNVQTMRSIEYMLECYRRSEFNCIDQFHVLDFNFDKAVIYNTEQVSGYLNLNLFPKNNITLSLEYPKLSTTALGYDILFSKEENKYNFNQFWDITADRGEFPVGSLYPTTDPVIPGTTILPGPYTEENMWITQPDGYIRTLNPVNLDYDKPLLQRKKFRHYLNVLHLSRAVSGDVNMILKITNSKNQISFR